MPVFVICCSVAAIIRPGLGGRDRNMGPDFGLGPGLCQGLIDTKQLDTQAVQRLSPIYYVLTSR